MTKTHLGSIADIITGPFGSALHQYEYVDEGVPVIMPQDIENRNVSYEKIAHITLQKAEELSRYAVIKNDIVYARRGDIEKHAFITSSTNGAICGTGCLRVRVKDTSVNPLFLSYYLDRPETRKWIVSHAVGSNMPNLNTDILSNIPVELPSKEEQDSIVSVLECIEKQIDNNTTICFDLETMAKLLYDYWFVQFDFPDENGKPYKSSGGKMAWNEQLKRVIPEGWKAGKISDLGDIIGGATPSTTNPEYYTDNGIAWATPKDLADSHTIFFSHGERDITKLGLDNCSATIMPKGSVLMTSRAPIGYLAIAENDVCTNQGFKSVIPHDSVGTYYVYYTLQLMMPYIKRYGVGSTFAEVSKQDLDGINVIIPDKRVCTHFNSILKDSFEKICLLEQENRQLANLRDFLLPMLMNGQVKAIIH